MANLDALIKHGYPLIRASKLGKPQYAIIGNTDAKNNDKLCHENEDTFAPLSAEPSSRRYTSSDELDDMSRTSVSPETPCQHTSLGVVYELVC